MKRVLLAITLALLIPGMLNAATLGAYFDWQPPGQMSYSPAAFTYFDVYLYMHNSGVGFITAIEYQLQTPSDPTHVFFGIDMIHITYPDNMAVTLGDPFTGHSISYWPPLDGANPGYNMMCHMPCFTTDPCVSEGGVLADYPLVIGAHPGSGELRGTYWPGNLFFSIDGLTSILCPEANAVEEKSWGAIKSLYK